MALGAISQPPYKRTMSEPRSGEGFPNGIRYSERVILAPTILQGFIESIVGGDGILHPAEVFCMEGNLME